MKTKTPKQNLEKKVGIEIIKEQKGQIKDLEVQLKKSNKETGRFREIVTSMSEKRDYIIPTKNKSNTLRFGVIGDTHIGSLYERADALQEFYKILKKEKINLVLHAGDVLAGHHMFRGQEYEVYALGFDRQKEAFIKNYPEIEGIHTYFITGNHDASFKRNGGINVGKELEASKKNFHYIGEDFADVVFKVGKKKAHYQLIHPDGGTPYAVSYRAQKIIESYSGGKKPRAVFIGHLHKADYMPMFRNVKSLLVGCFESQTPFMARKPTPAHVGGWIIEDTLGNGLSDRMKAEFIAFYEPLKVKNIKRR